MTKYIKQGKYKTGSYQKKTVMWCFTKVFAKQIV